ncbi:hypothetical protein HID58_069617 [Brassica napus]|uniref:RRM domain-containing protein n=1 Tax=Brassica napus TaxID=3708 RepID=A0ABQ7YWF5_BRANA|nr:hypothetical protein HID58_069617 [Brassica napus]
MGKKSATKVEAAPAAIKATKPLKKGKREPEDDLETKVNLKKQKKDLVAAVQKEKAEKKVPKKVESSDESDSSDSEEEDKAKKVPAKKAPVEAASSSDDDADDSSSDDEPAQKKAVASTNGIVAKKAKDESSSEEESSDEESEDEKTAPKAKEGTKTAEKDSSSDDSGSEESESEDEKETPKKKSSDVEMVDAEKHQRGERPAYTPQSGTGNNFRSGGGGGEEVFVKGFDSSLPPNDIKSALREHFASCGEITRVSVPIDRETGGSRGIAYVEFKEGTKKAFELNGSDMGGWNIVVDQPRQKENNNSGGGFNGGRSGGRDNFRGRGRGRDNFRGRGRDNGRGRPSFTSQAKKTVFSDETVEFLYLVFPAIQLAVIECRNSIGAPDCFGVYVVGVAL